MKKMTDDVCSSDCGSGRCGCDKMLSDEKIKEIQKYIDLADHVEHIMKEAIALHMKTVPKCGCRICMVMR